MAQDGIANNPNGLNSPESPLNPNNPNSLLNPNNPKSLLNPKNPASPFYKGGDGTADDKEVGNKLARAIQKASPEEIEILIQQASPAELYAAADAASAAGDTALAAELQSDADEKRAEETPKPVPDAKKNDQQNSPDDADTDDMSDSPDDNTDDDETSPIGPVAVAGSAAAAAMLTGGAPDGLGPVFLPPGVPGSPIPGAGMMMLAAAGNTITANPSAASFFLGPAALAGTQAAIAGSPAATTASSAPQAGMTKGFSAAGNASSPKPGSATSKTTTPLSPLALKMPAVPAPPRPRASPKNDD